MLEWDWLALYTCLQNYLLCVYKIFSTFTNQYGKKLLMFKMSFDDRFVFVLRNNWNVMQPIFREIVYTKKKREKMWSRWKRWWNFSCALKCKIWRWCVLWLIIVFCCFFFLVFCVLINLEILYMINFILSNWLTVNI